MMKVLATDPKQRPACFEAVVSFRKIGHAKRIDSLITVNRVFTHYIPHQPLDMLASDENLPAPYLTIHKYFDIYLLPQH